MSKENLIFGIFLTLQDLDIRRSLVTRPFSDEDHKGRYDRLAQSAEARGMKVVILIEGAYISGNTFSTYWTFEGSSWREVNENSTVDLIFIKSVHLVETLDENASVASHAEIEKLNDDKQYMYSFFSEMMAPSYLINATNWNEVLATISTEKVALKPIDGSCGDGIVIGNKSDVSIDQLVPEYSYIAQEFIDGSKGIPGIVEGYHDLRIIVYNGVPRLATVRIAPEGSMIANVALGASLKILSFDEVPQASLDLLKTVDAKLSVYKPRIYTVDIMYHQGEKPYLVEINTAPGFPTLEVHGAAYVAQFNDCLLDAFLESISFY